MLSMDVKEADLLVVPVVSDSDVNVPTVGELFNVSFYYIIRILA